VTESQPERTLAIVSGLILEDGRTWGEAAHAWQLGAMREFLDPSAPPHHFDTRPRGASKTTDAAAAIGLLVDQAPEGSRSYAVAADADQAALLLDALRGFAIRSELFGALKLEARRVTVVDTDARLEVLAADGASAYGLRPWLVVVDELVELAHDG
jgi:phage terminase large subunit-like protein